MRARLQWDVLFVLEEADLRRAPDVKHYQLAQQLRRTLVTLDRDYLDDRRFPLDALRRRARHQAPDERQLSALLDRIDRSLFHPDDARTNRSALPLAGRKLQVNTDWGRESDSALQSSMRRAAPSRSRVDDQGRCSARAQVDAAAIWRAAATSAGARCRATVRRRRPALIGIAAINPESPAIAPVVVAARAQVRRLRQRTAARCRRERRPPRRKRGSARRAA